MSKLINPFREAIPFIAAKANGQKATFFSAPEDRRYVNLCSAIDHGMRQLRSRYVVSEKEMAHLINLAQVHIGKCLQGSMFATGWVYRYIPGAKEILGPCEWYWVQGQTPEKAALLNEIQAFRIRWCEHLADQYDQGLILEGTGRVSRRK